MAGFGASASGTEAPCHQGDESQELLEVAMCLSLQPESCCPYTLAAGYSPIRRPFSITSAVIASTCGVGTPATRAKAWTEVRIPSISGGRAASKSCSIEDLCGMVGAVG